MRHFQLLGLLGLLCGLALLFSWSIRTEPERDPLNPQATLQGNAGPDKLALSPSLPPPRRLLDGGDEWASSPECGKVSVVVDREDGGDLSGLPVQVKLESEAESETIRGVTDASGNAVFEVAVGRRVTSVGVLATPKTPYRGKWIGRVSLAGVTVNVALRVQVGWPLGGRVLRADGTPVSGAEVFGWCRDQSQGEPDRVTTTNSLGEFRIEHLGRRFRVVARAPGMATSRGLRGELSNETLADELTITLTPEHILRGIVFGPTGLPIEGAEIQVDSSNTESDYNRTHVQGVWRYTPADIRTRTRADGHFELRGLASGSYHVQARCAPYLVRRQYLQAGSEIHEITLDLGLSLRGQVLTPDGLPAEGARIRFWPYKKNTHGVDLFAYCDEDGEFHLVGMGRPKAGGDTVRKNDPPFAIAIEHRGHALHVLQPVVPGPNGGEYVKVRLEPERVIGGCVVDDSGTPVPGARVSIEGDRDMETGVSWGRRNTWEFCFGIADTQTNLQGYFRFDRLYPGEFTIQAVSPWDPNQAVRTTRRSGDESIELVFGSSEGSGVVLFGGVQDSRTGQAVSTFQIVPMIGGAGTVRTFEATEGQYELSGLPAAEIQLAFRARGYASRNMESRVYADGRHRIDVELTPSRSLELMITNGRGVPYKHGRIQVLDFANAIVPLKEGIRETSQASIRAGKATLRGIPAELLTLKIAVPGADGRFELHEVSVDLTHSLPEPYPIVVE